MELTLPSETVFHAIESAIKTYRKFSQHQISASIPDITLDQGLALIYIHKYPELSQNALAGLLFRDNASLTRMIKLMVKHDYIKRAMNPNDLRRYKLLLTDKGKKVVDALPTVIAANRNIALKGITEEDERDLKRILNKIKTNCTKQSA